MKRFEKIICTALVALLSLIGSHLLISTLISEYDWMLKQGLSDESASFLTFLFLMIASAGTAIYIFRKEIFK